jgi:hypothetical protein
MEMNVNLLFQSGIWAELRLVYAKKLACVAKKRRR